MHSVATFRAVFEAKLPGYDALLSKTKYIAGDVRPCVSLTGWHKTDISYHAPLQYQEISLVDLFHLPYGALLKVQGYDYLESKQYPNIARLVGICQHAPNKSTKITALSGGGRMSLPVRHG